MRYFLTVLSLGFSVLAAAQHKPKHARDSWASRDTTIVIGGDTVHTKLLHEFTYFMPLRLKNHSDRIQYLYLKRKVYRVFKYAKIASDSLIRLQKAVDEVQSRRAKRRIVKKLQRYMKAEFADPLKALSRTDGQILVKLVCRQTQHTPFEIIKAYKSGWSAFWWNVKANLFDISLKKTYDPKGDRADRFIEDIIQKGLSSGELKE